MDKQNKRDISILIITSICILISFFVIKNIWKSVFSIHQAFSSSTLYFILQCVGLLFYFTLLEKCKNVKVLHIVYMGMLLSLLVLIPTGLLKLSKGVFWFKRYVDYLYFPAFAMFTGLAFIGAIFPFLQKKDSSKEISVINNLIINGTIFIVLVIVFAIEKFFNIKF